MQASHASIEELRSYRRRGESIYALDISPHGSSGYEPFASVNPEATLNTSHAGAS